MRATFDLITWTLTAVMLCGCSAGGETPQENFFMVKGDTDTVLIDPGSKAYEKITTGEAACYPYSREFVTAGTIQPIPTRYSYIAPPFSGRIVRSHIKLGQKVSAGTALFEMISPDFLEVQKDFFQASSEKELAEKDLRRKHDLYVNGVGSLKELEEAESIYNICLKEYENAVAAVKVFHADPQTMALGQTLIIRAPISGTVIENNVVSGDYIREDSEPVAVVADLSQVWITAQVKEKDLRHISNENRITVEIPAYPDMSIQGSVYHIDDSVDEETRSVKVYCQCDNLERLLKVGMYVSVQFSQEKTEIVVVLEKSLLQDEISTYVFKMDNTQENKFVKRPVTVDVTRDGLAYISHGLDKGDVIITEGGFYLR